MYAQEIYEKETGLKAYNSEYDILIPTNKYMNWLENLVENRYEPTILKWIKNVLEHAKKKQWFETYWTFDIHGTISKPDYRKPNYKGQESTEILYYPYAKETLQLMSERKDIVMILWTSSYPDEMKIYRKTFINDNIIFNYENENPEVQTSKGSFGFYEKKHYFNVLFEDKAGFNPERDWKFLYDYFKNTEYKPDPNWSMKYNENYHKK